MLNGCRIGPLLPVDPTPSRYGFVLELLRDSAEPEAQLAHRPNARFAHTASARCLGRDRLGTPEMGAADEELRALLGVAGGRASA